jgi:hypothetical protein
MHKPRRFTEAQKQEAHSRKQLEECFLSMGWLASVPPDLGEDFIFTVYFDGIAAGVTFYVQLKSITNLDQRKKGDSLPYRFATKDLEHWQPFLLPVVLIVWDVNRKEGRWVLADSAISDLDKRFPRWRTQKTATIYLPWINTTDRSGLLHLKAAIGRRLYPIISNGKNFSVQFSFLFENTPEGRSNLEAWERFYKEGEQVTLSGPAIRSIKFPEWWERWQESIDPDKVQLTIGPSASSRSFPIAVDVLTETGVSSSLSNIILKNTKSGTEVIRLSNEDQDAPFSFYIKVNTRTKRVNVTLSLRTQNLGYNVDETLRLMAFCQALAVGGTMTITFLDNPDAPVRLNVPPGPDWEPNQDFVEIVKKLCRVQRRLGASIRIPQRDISSKDIEAIDELTAITEHGKTVRKRPEAAWTLQLNDPQALLTIYKSGANFLWRGNFPESHVELFGTRIATGPMTRQITGRLDMPYEDLLCTSARLAPGEPLSLVVRQASILG